MSNIPPNLDKKRCYICDRQLEDDLIYCEECYLAEVEPIVWEYAYEDKFRHIDPRDCDGA